MQCNDGLGRAIEEMSNRTNRANQLMLIFWPSANFRPFYDLYVFDANSSCFYAYFRRFYTLFGANFHRAKSALELIFPLFACPINLMDFSFRLCKRRTCRFPSRGRECWRAPKAQSSASGSSLQRCGF